MIPKSQKAKCTELRTLGLELGELSPRIPDEQQCPPDSHTRIWLDDVAADLASASAADREYTGFDISRNHFPVDKPGMRFLEHDVLKPFPEEFHSQYDLVHIRFLVLALKKEDFKTATSNVAALLSECFLLPPVLQCRQLQHRGPHC